MAVADAPVASASPRVATTLFGSSDLAPRLAIALLVIVDGVAIAAAIARFGLVTRNTVILVGLALWSLALGQHYRLKLHLSVLDDMMAIAGRVVVAVSLGAAYRELVSGHDVFTVDRLWVLVGSVAFVLLGRTVAYLVLRVLRYSGFLQRKTLVIGSPETANEINQAIASRPSCGLTPVDQPLQTATSVSACDLAGADVAIVEVTDSSDQDVARLIRRQPRPGLELYLLPTALIRYPAMIPAADQLASLPLLPIRPVANRSVRWKLKRVIDVVIATSLLPLAAPVVLASATILRWEGGPGVLFRQERVGLGGSRFTMYKLRTIAADRSETGSAWSVAAEQISPFARFCRMVSIDELPQLWNVIRGDMSMVGPRPERPHFVTKFSASIPDYEHRHRVPVGLTGLAQVHGLRGDTSILQRSRFDNSYIDSWSLFQDLKILCLTVSSMVTPRGRGS